MAVRLLAVASKESWRLPEMSHLQASPCGPSWRQQWWDYRNHPAAPYRSREPRAKNNKLVPHSITLQNTHKWVYVWVCLPGGGKGGMSRWQGVECWHFCGISCLLYRLWHKISIGSHDYACVCVGGHLRLRSREAPQDKWRNNKGSFSISSSST